MVIDPANVASVYAADKTQNLSSVNAGDDQKRDDIPQPENSQTSEVGPAVVTDLSAAALETSRAVTEGNQAADLNRAETRDTNKEQAVAAQAETGRQGGNELDIVA